MVARRVTLCGLTRRITRRIFQVLSTLTKTANEPDQICLESESEQDAPLLGGDSASHVHRPSERSSHVHPTFIHGKGLFSTSKRPCIRSRKVGVLGLVAACLMLGTFLLQTDSLRNGATAMKGVLKRKANVNADSLRDTYTSVSQQNRLGHADLTAELMSCLGEDTVPTSRNCAQQTLGHLVTMRNSSIGNTQIVCNPGSWDQNHGYWWNPMTWGRFLRTKGDKVGGPGSARFGTFSWTYESAQLADPNALELRPSCHFSNVMLSRSGDVFSTKPVPAMFAHPTFEYYTLPCDSFWPMDKRLEGAKPCRREYELKAMDASLKEEISLQQMPVLDIPVFVFDMKHAFNFGHFNLNLLLPLVYRMARYYEERSLDHAVPKITTVGRTDGKTSGSTMHFDKNNLLVFGGSPQPSFSPSSDFGPKKFWSELRNLSNWPVLSWESFTDFLNTTGNGHVVVKRFIVNNEDSDFEIRDLMGQHKYVELARELLTTPSPPPVSILHWSRTDGRTPVNVDELEDALTRAGYAVTNIKAGSLDVKTQMSLFNRFDIVLSPYGSSYMPAIFSYDTTELVILNPACCTAGFGYTDRVAELAGVTMKRVRHYKMQPNGTWEQPELDCCRPVQEQHSQCWTKVCQHPLVGTSRVDVESFLEFLHQ